MTDPSPTLPGQPGQEAGEEGSDDAEKDPGRREVEIAHREAWPWLPTQARGDLAPHPYDTETGKVMAVGRRGMDLGGLVNLLADLQRVMTREGLTVTDVQKRLILKELKERDADDAFGLARETQLGIVAEVASQYLGVHREAVLSYLRTC